MKLYSSKNWEIANSCAQGTSSIAKLTPRRSVRLHPNAGDPPLSPPLSENSQEPSLSQLSEPNPTELDAVGKDIIISPNPILYGGNGAGRSRGNGVGRGRGRGMGVDSWFNCSSNDSEPVITLSETQPHSTLHPSQPQVSAPIKFPKSNKAVNKKIPITTARRKGLFVPKKVSDTLVDDSGLENTCTSVLANIISNEVHLGDNDYVMHVYGLNGNASNDLDESYSPRSALHDFDDDEDDDEDDDDDDDDVHGQMIVVDNFNPCEEPQWNEMLEEEEDSNYFTKLYENGELYTNQEFGKIELKNWQLFADNASNKRYTIHCSALNCPWRLHASRLPDGHTWAIKSIRNPEHACAGLETRNSMVSAKWAARVLLEDIRANNDIPAMSLNELLWSRYKVQMTKSTLYRMRSLALLEIHGGFDQSYRHQPKYCEVIKLTNPYSSANCAWHPLSHPERPLAFKSIFISFKACLDGLLAGCRSLIGVYGCHLKGNYGGILLSAVAMDGNNELFPFAWAIVVAEDTDSWMFFIWHLKNLLKDSGRGDEWCFILDRQKGIDAALNKF